MAEGKKKWSGFKDEKEVTEQEIPFFFPPICDYSIIPALACFPSSVLFLIYISLYPPNPEQTSMLVQLESSVKILVGFETQKSLERNSYSAQSHWEWKRKPNPPLLCPHLKSPVKVCLVLIVLLQS